MQVRVVFKLTLAHSLRTTHQFFLTDEPIIQSTSKKPTVVQILATLGILVILASLGIAVAFLTIGTEKGKLKKGCRRD